MSRVLLVTVVLAVVAAVHGYGKGAPKEACGDMVPQHHTPPQTSAFPYLVTANKKIIKSGDRVQLIISSGAGVKDFQGFFVQARVGETPIGKFSAGPGINLVNCGAGQSNGATHSKADKKNKIAVEWTAPPGLTEQVRFYVTVAKNGGEFWVKQPTVALSVKKA